MILKFNYTYYLHNTGNNGRKLFYQEKNYDYFIQKMKKAIAPFAKIIQFHLEENAFHILIETRNEIPDKMLNHQIGICLRSYAQAINKQEQFFGSLFRQRTKAYSRLSKIPTDKRKNIIDHIKYIQQSKLVDFALTIKKYLKALGKTEMTSNKKQMTPPIPIMDDQHYFVTKKKTVDPSSPTQSLPRNNSS